MYLEVSDPLRTNYRYSQKFLPHSSNKFRCKHPTNRHWNIHEIYLKDNSSNEITTRI